MGAAQKIVLGYDDGLFRPDRGVSREDMITLLYRYAGSPKTSGRKLAEFRDNASISDYARQAMEWAVENGLILGYAEDGTIRPQSTTTRAGICDDRRAVLREDECVKSTCFADCLRCFCSWR